MRRQASSQSTRRVSCAHKRHASNYTCSTVCVAIYKYRLAYLHERDSEDGILQRLQPLRVFSRLNVSAKQDIKHLDLQWLGQDQGSP